MMHERERVELSPAGEARRDAMLSSLTDEMARVRVRRRRVRRGAVAACVLIAAGVVASQFAPGPAAPSQPTAVAVHPASTRPAPVIQPVRTEDLGLRHISVEATPPRSSSRIRVIGDAELVAALHEAGRPSGVIRVEGRVMLTSAVTDEGTAPGL